MENKTRKKKIRWFRISLWTSVYLSLVFGGFILGMIYEQRLLFLAVGEALSYSDVEINVNLNATKFAEELNNTFIPAWKLAFNETLNNQLNLTNK